MCAMLSGLFIAGDNGRPPQTHKQKLVTLNSSTGDVLNSSTGDALNSSTGDALNSSTGEMP